MPRQRDEDGLGWLDDLETEEVRPVTAGGGVVPRALLEQIASDANQPATARVQAAKALHEMGVVGDEDPGWTQLMAQVAALSGEDLDKELAGFFNPGYQPDANEDHIEREVERRMASTRKAIERRLRRLRGGDKTTAGANSPQTDDETLEPADVLDPASDGNDGVRTDLATGQRTELVRRPLRAGKHGTVVEVETVRVSAPDLTDPAVLWGDGPGVPLGEEVTHARARQGRRVGGVDR
jgi:hypothetical protein